MAAKAYCTTADVADSLGVELTPAQEVQASREIETVTLEIDKKTDRAWLVGAQTAEKHYHSSFQNGSLYLRFIPVASIQEVRGRSGLSSSERVLVENTDYEVISLDGGLIRLISPGLFDRVTVDYTPVDDVPLPIQRACARWVAARMFMSVNQIGLGVESYSLPDLSVKFSRSLTGGEMPADVRETLEKYHWDYS